MYMYTWVFISATCIFRWQISLSINGHVSSPMHKAIMQCIYHDVCVQCMLSILHLIYSIVQYAYIQYNTMWYNVCVHCIVSVYSSKSYSVLNTV